MEDDSFFCRFLNSLASLARAFYQSIESMTSTEDRYQFSMNDSISETPRTRCSSRNRKPTNRNVPKPAQERITTRSSQKSPLRPMNDENDHSFMSDINSGFSQFVNPKKRQRDEKKTKTFKRPKGMSVFLLISFFFISFISSHNLFG
jgi:hypothetical protein